MAIIKRIIGYYSTVTDQLNLLYYIANPAKTHGLTGSINVVNDVMTCVDRMQCVRQFYNGTDGIQLYHLIVSAEEFNGLSTNAMLDVAYQIADFFGSLSHQVYFGVHKESSYGESCRHIHIAICSVCFKNGRKLHQNYDLLNQFRHHVRKTINCYEVILE